MTATTFKQRYAQHLYTFRHQDSKDETELAKYIWKLKNKGTNFTIQWEKITNGKPFESGDKFCILCNKEKTEIVTAELKSTLNSMNIIEKCRHKKSQMLADVSNSKG